MSTETAFSLANYGITVKKIFRNASPGQLYELGLQNEPGTISTEVIARRAAWRAAKHGGRSRRVCGGARAGLPCVAPRARRSTHTKVSL